MQKFFGKFWMRLQKRFDPIVSHAGDAHSSKWECVRRSWFPKKDDCYFNFASWCGWNVSHFTPFFFICAPMILFFSLCLSMFTTPCKYFFWGGGLHFIQKFTKKMHCKCFGWRCPYFVYLMSTLYTHNWMKWVLQ